MSTIAPSFASTSSSVLALAAVAGLASGLPGCGGADAKKDPAPGGSAKAATTAAGTAEPLHEQKKDCCTGKNECKGKGGCKTASNECAGKNECKGKGGCSMRDCK